MGEGPIVIRSEPFTGLTAREFHDIVRLREAVFVVEQHCRYAELDGQDVVPQTLHLWIEQGGGVASYLRLYPGAEDSDWIGRVVTAAEHRRRGLATRLVEAALTRARRPVRLAAQSAVVAWYEGFGFRICGAVFDEDGIAHTPMRLP